MRHITSLHNRTAIAIFLALLLITHFSSHLLPFHMDEFLPYQAFGCLVHPLTRGYNHFYDGCSEYDLRLPFTHTYLPLRSYPYVGSFSAIPYALLWLIWRNPVSLRVQGWIFFSVTSYLIAKLAKASFQSVLLAALFLPVLFFTFIIDTGPAGLPIVLLLTTLLLLRNALASTDRRKQLLLASLAGLTSFLGAWIKLTYLWNIVPICLILFEPALFSLKKLLRYLWRQWMPILVFALSFGLPLLLLLFAQDRANISYYQTQSHSWINLTSVKDVWIQQRQYFFNASFASQRVATFPKQFFDIIPSLIIVGLLGWGLSRPKLRQSIVTALIMAASVLGLVLCIPQAGAPHHFVLWYVFVVWALAIVIEALWHNQPRLINGLFIIALVTWGSLAARLPHATIFVGATANKDTLLQTVAHNHQDQTTVQVHTSWGTYYIQHLYGDRKQINFYIPDFTTSPQEIVEVKAIAKREHRRVLIYTNETPLVTNSALITSHFGPPITTSTFGTWSALEYELH